MKKVLYYKEYESPIFYGKLEHKVKSYIKIEMFLNLKQGLWFCVGVPNLSYCDRNIFRALFKVLEHESIGMSKYNRLKEDIRSKGII